MNSASCDVQEWNHYEKFDEGRQRHLEVDLYCPKAGLNSRWYAEPTTNVVYDEVPLPFASAQSDFTGKYTSTWPESTFNIAGLEQSQEFSAGAGNLQHDFINDGTQLPRTVAGNDFQSIYATQPSYGIAGPVNWHNNVLSTWLPTDLVGSSGPANLGLDDTTWYKYDTNLGEQLPATTAMSQSVLSVQEAFSIENSRYDFPNVIGYDWPQFSVPSLDTIANSSDDVNFLVPNWLQDSAPAFVAAQAQPHQATAARVQCPTCNSTFKRDSDFRRHTASKHQAYHGVHLCSVAGCSRGQGTGFPGYTRADKLTEHMWKKHGDLGYTKA